MPTKMRSIEIDTVLTHFAAIEAAFAEFSDEAKAILTLAACIAAVEIELNEIRFKSVDRS